MKIVFLIIDYVPHQILLIKTLLENYDVEIMAYHVSRFVTETPSELKNFSTQQYKTIPKNEILKKIELFNPSVVVTAGWMIPEYNWVCKQMKKTTNIPVVAMSDTPWYGTFKQKINTVISPFHVKKAFTHLWVAGLYQYDYARKLGFENDEIIYNCLSANTYLFSGIDIKKKIGKYPKNFLYIGRYTEVKGLQNLMIAWSAIEDKKDWTFTLIGNGEMREELIKDGNFIVKDYLHQDELVNELAETGCFVLPSLHEPWALVLHEAAAAGIPIICTNTCGAAPHFVIDHYNGFKVDNDSVSSLTEAMKKIIETDVAELVEYSYNSRKLSNAISPEKSAASLMQLANN